MALEKGQISSCVNFPLFPFSLQSKPGCSKKAWAEGALLWPTFWQAASPRLLSALKLGRFSSVFSSQPPTAPSVLLPCPQLQAAAVPSPPLQSHPQALFIPGQQEEGGIFPPVPSGFVPSASYTFTGTQRIARGPWVAAPAHPGPPWSGAAGGCPHQGQEVPKPCWDPPAVFQQLLRHQGGNRCRLGS